MMRNVMKLSCVWTIIIGMLLATSVHASGPAVTCRVSLDREALPAGAPQKAIIKVSLVAPEAPREDERPPVNLALVLDRSGSMSGDKIAKAREAAIEALRRLSPRDVFSLVAYDHSVQTLVPAQRAENTAWIEQQIRAIRPGGNTALFGAVSQGAAEVRKNLGRGYVHRVILLSDGLANVGPSSPQDLGRLGAALLKEGVSVSTVGVGVDFNEDLMARLAEKSDGNHYFVESSVDLPRIFAAELGDVLSVVARRVRIEIECPAGVRPLRIIGREGRIRGNRVEIGMNQLYGSQEKYALIEVEVPAGRADQKIELAAVNCAYENTLNHRQEQSQTVALARYTASVAEVKKSASKDVYRAVVENEIAEARDKALDLYNTGKRDEAAVELKQKSEALQQQAEEVGLGGVAAPAAALEAEADEFVDEGLSSERKKEIRSESFKVRTQQKDY
mgnify:CR=1 FL=1